MKPDAHTPCPACAIQVRYLHDTATVLARLLAGQSLPADVAHVLAEPLANVQRATEMLRPFVEAHLANQEHAHTADLERDRNPQLGAGSP